MLGMIVGFELEPHVPAVTESSLELKSETFFFCCWGFLTILWEHQVTSPFGHQRCGSTSGEIIKVKAHYNWSMYQALLNATKSSLKAPRFLLIIVNYWFIDSLQNG